MIDLLFATNFCQSNGEEIAAVNLSYSELSFDICKKRNSISNWNHTLIEGFSPDNTRRN